MLDMKIKAGRRTVVPGDLPAILGAQRAYRELGDMVEALIAQMDMLAGDCDLEPEQDFGADDVGEEQVGEWATLHYGIDQTREPINKGAIEAEARRRQNEASRRDYEIFLSRHGRSIAA